jgi:predicted  nucleic acid-binding Zn-ribbon protein
MITDEKMSDIVRGIVMLLTGLITEPMNELSNMVEIVKATTDRLTVEINELESKMEHKINSAISEVEVSTDYDELRRQLDDAVDTMNDEIYELRTEVENMESQVEQNEEYARNNNYTLTQIRDALNDNHDSL